MILHFLNTVATKTQFHYRQLFKPDVWNIGILERPIQSLLNDDIKPDHVKWFPAPKNGEYFADPFALKDGDSLKVYFERYSYQNRKGNISTANFSSGKWMPGINTVLEETYHASYPFLIEHENSYYCVPETAEYNQVDLYRVDIDNNMLILEKTLIQAVKARDPSMFQYNGYWWIFCTLQDGPNSKLHIYYSKDFLGPYLPHRNNPVKQDLKSSRPAGTPFYVDNALYRPAQDCSESYGKKVTINRVLKLSPDAFEEVVEKTIESIFGPYGEGIHTISAIGDYTLIDGRHSTFIWANFTFQLNRKIKKILNIS